MSSRAPPPSSGSTRQRWLARSCLPAALVLILAALVPAGARSAGAEPSRAADTLDINEYRVEGVQHLRPAEVEAALAPYLGPGRRREDVEAARQALEKAYVDKGYQSVTVAIPPQTVRGGMVTLKVTESKVGRLRVNGSRWFSLSEIKREAPSVQEGTLPNLNELMQDIVVLNQLPDRRVTPSLHAGATAGTVDVDLNVEDRLPLHASLELNNRYSSETTPLRLNGTARYDNLWQQGHSLTLSFQVAPLHRPDAEVFSLTYLARFLDLPSLTLTLNGYVQNSDISTLGAGAVKGRGRTAGARFSYALPGPAELYHAVTAGIDYKYYGPDQPDDPYSLDLHYVPVLLQYTAALAAGTSQSLLTASVVFNIRGLSSSDAHFDSKRYGATGTFIRFELDASRTQDLGKGFQLFGRFQGFLSPNPLVPSEQISAGGVDSVRGYLEAQASGDRDLLGSVELRSPSFGQPLRLDEWRVHVFTEGGWVGVNDTLPEQQSKFYLWSAGAGTRLRFKSLSGSLDLGIPFRTLNTTHRFEPRLQFSVTGEL